MGRDVPEVRKSVRERSKVVGGGWGRQGGKVGQTRLVKTPRQRIESITKAAPRRMNITEPAAVGLFAVDISPPALEVNRVLNVHKNHKAYLGRGGGVFGTGGGGGGLWDGGGGGGEFPHLQAHGDGERGRLYIYHHQNGRLWWPCWIVSMATGHQK